MNADCAIPTASFHHSRDQSAGSGVGMNFQQTNRGWILRFLWPAGAPLAATKENGLPKGQPVIGADAVAAGAILSPKSGRA
jgi:hypothetical protein